MLQQIRDRLEERKITVQLSEQARDFIAREAYDPVYGARPLRRYLQQHVETPLAKEIIAGRLLDGQEVIIDIENNQLIIKIQ